MANTWYDIVQCYTFLTHCGRMMHICVAKLTIIGSDNGLSPGRRQAIIWTNAGLLLIRHLGTNFSEILIGIQTFSFKKMHFKMSFAKWRPFCLGLNVLNDQPWISYHRKNHERGNLTYLCLGTNGHRSAALGRLPFIFPPVFVQAAEIWSW